MNRKVTSIVAILILVIFLFVFVFSFLSPFLVGAASKSDVNNKINSASSDKKKIQGQIDQAKEQKNNALEEKNSIETKIKTVQGQINSIQSEINVLDGKISAKQAELTAAEEKAKQQYDSMKVRLRTMYEDNSTSYITLLLGGESLSDIVSYAELIKQVLNHDDTMYDRMIETQNEIEAAKTEIESEKKTQETKKSAVVAKKSELSAENQKLSATVTKIDGDIAEYKKAYDAAEKEEKALKAQLAKMLASEQQKSVKTYYTGGVLNWPAPGYSTITSPYGYRFHPTLKVNKLHTGVDIGAPMGATVVAAEAGTVVTACYNTAYGNYIVINHGGGLSTLYAHNSSLLVSKGATVTRGQAIAKVGSTGFSTGAHCHFEVLVNGQCTNPMNYL